VTVQFGGCDNKKSNCLPIMRGWNYTVRLYRPPAEILNGTWKFPQPQPTTQIVQHGGKRIARMADESRIPRAARFLPLFSLRSAPTNCTIRGVAAD
jgi:hypothetical protein